MTTEKEQKSKASDRRTNIIHIMMPIMIILVIVLVLSLFTAWQKKRVERDADYVINQMADHIVININMTLGYAKSSINAVAASVSQSMTKEELDNPSQVLSPLIKNTPFKDIEFIRPDGMNVSNVGEAFDASDRVYYKQGIKGNSGIWINYKPKNTRDVLIDFYTPLRYEGKIAGVLAGYIAANSQMASYLQTEFLGKEVYSIILDENNMVICTSIKSDYVPEMTFDMLLDAFDVRSEKKERAFEALKNRSGEVFAFKNKVGEGRVCIKKVADTGWTVMVFIPPKSFEDVVEISTKNAVLAISIVVLILVFYVAHIIGTDLKKRRLIVAANKKLEEDNRIIDEENRKAFAEISGIRDIISSANMGTWRIELVEGRQPRMFVDDKMKELLGVAGNDRTPEQTYTDWYDNITEEAVPGVIQSVEKMKTDGFDENTYLWKHPAKGLRYVRCGGTSREIPGGYVLRGYHYDVDELVRKEQANVNMLKEALADKNEYYATLGALGDIFYSMHVIDLVNDTATTINAKDDVARMSDSNKGARELMKEAMSTLTAYSCREEVLEFTNLDTVVDRMQNKIYAEHEFVGVHAGWYLASFIVMERSENGRPIKLIFATRDINEEKKQEQKLIYKSQTDELTKAYNRRAYEEALLELEEKGIPGDFAYFSFDLNGLKMANDTIGHEAGDELIVGSSNCIKEALCGEGRLFRTGGDEFVVLTCLKEKELEDLCIRLKDNIDSWHGKLVDSLSVSFAYAAKAENPEASLHDISVLADKRMYDAKSMYYRKAGVDRRGRKDAHIALISLYVKILKINVTSDTYQVVDLKQGEPVDNSIEKESISRWLLDFGKKGYIHEDDLQAYYEKTDILFLRKYFRENLSPLRVTYRRKYKDSYRLSTLEIIKANDYTDDNQSLFLYVRKDEE